MTCTATYSYNTSSNEQTFCVLWQAFGADVGNLLPSVSGIDSRSLNTAMASDNRPSAVSRWVPPHLRPGGPPPEDPRGFGPRDRWGYSGEPGYPGGKIQRILTFCNQFC